MIDTVKHLSGNNNDTIVNFAIKKAILAITKHINNPMINVEIEYETAIIDLAVYYINNRSHSGLKSISQGSVSLSFDKDGDIPSDIRALLPQYVRVY